MPPDVPHPDARAYGGRADLAPLLAFASKIVGGRFPFDGGWHPGDFVWALKATYDQPQDNRMWASGANIEAVAWFEGPGVWMEALPSRDELIIEMVAWAETSLRTRKSGSSAPQLSIRAFEHDRRRVEVLEALGYRRAEPEGVHFRFDLAATVPVVEAPAAGFLARDCASIDPVARASVHRAAWNDLAHIGLPDARSTFSTEVYLSLKEAPLYDPSLDIVVEAPDGQLVANCICWADAESGVGIFEPVGTSAAFRGRRLARLAIHEGLRRLQARGMAWAIVSTAHFNAAAIAAYQACGFALSGRTHWWTKSVGEGDR